MINKYEWLNKDSRKFLERGYLLEGETPEQRIRDIAEAAENILKSQNFNFLIQPMILFGEINVVFQRFDIIFTLKSLSNLQKIKAKHLS